MQKHENAKTAKTRKHENGENAKTGKRENGENGKTRKPPNKKVFWFSRFSRFSRFSGFLGFLIFLVLLAGNCFLFVLGEGKFGFLCFLVFSVFWFSRPRRSGPRRAFCVLRNNFCAWNTVLDVASRRKYPWTWPLKTWWPR